MSFSLTCYSSFLKQLLAYYYDASNDSPESVRLLKHAYLSQCADHLLVHLMRWIHTNWLSFVFNLVFVQYNSGASSEADVEEYNFDSYKSQVEEKLWDEGLDAYINADDMYFCKFHASKKIPRDGTRNGLVDHVRAASRRRGVDLRSEANHAALLNVLTHGGHE